MLLLIPPLCHLLNNLIDSSGSVKPSICQDKHPPLLLSVAKVITKVEAKSFHEVTEICGKTLLGGRCSSVYSPAALLSRS